MPDKIEIISYGGPDPSIRIADFSRGIIRARRYRNRRIGEFLKELRLTEGRGTGIPTIKARLADNGSPAPVFDTDGEDRRYFLIEIPIHRAFLELSRDYVETKLQEIDNSDDLQGVASILSDFLQHDLDLFGDEVQTKLETKLDEKIKTILKRLETPGKRAEILKAIGLTNNTINHEKYISPLLKAGWIEMTIPEKPNSSKQQYRLTSEGQKIKSLLHG